MPIPHAWKRRKSCVEETPAGRRGKIEMMETHTGKAQLRMTIQMPILRKNPQPAEGEAAAVRAADSPGKLPRLEIHLWQ